ETRIQLNALAAIDGDNQLPGLELPVVSARPQPATAERSTPDQANTQAPLGGQVDQMLIDIFQRTQPIEEGTLADYIPELATVPRDSYGIAIATTKGKTHTVGDAHTEFTIQSTSKALTYCLALELCGRKEVLGCVGVEPSGDPFNAI